MTARTTKCKIGDVNADSIAHNIRENGQSPGGGTVVTFVSLSLLIDNALYEKGLVSPRRSVSGQYAGVCATGSSADSTRYFGRMESDEQRGSRGAGRPRATSIG